MFRASFKDKNCSGLKELHSKVKAAHSELDAEYQKFHKKKAKINKLLNNLDAAIEEHESDSEFSEVTLM